ncbi:galactose-1-phosphate uridyl transferase [Emydomyces testavorans]|uniref:Galactose-1-phosphate uridylyltransferase n=1 Tax=Emydomyces testavorans TaxID=2070801 RepID=A0AAF0DJW4_9EURO|nr:galactose-1-phosphate uridyl transferase [Emydomyces testavorans]
MSSFPRIEPRGRGTEKKDIDTPGLARGQQESPTKTSLPPYDPACYLCPGNKRAQGNQNPQYTKPFVFVNDFSAVKEEQSLYHPASDKDDLASTFLQAEPVTGRCYVLTFSANHNLTLADLSPNEITPIVNAWTDIYISHLALHSPLLPCAQTEIPPDSPALQISKPKQQYRYMQIFENKGAAMGCSNPHPHGQIWTTSSLPGEPEQELEQLKKYRRERSGRHMLEDYVLLEREKQERIVSENDAFLTLCPWWAIWPFETIIISKSHKRSLADLTGNERAQLAEAIAEITRRWNERGDGSVPPASTFLSAVAEKRNGQKIPSWRDITPEQAAARLRACGGKLYRKSFNETSN